jgi:hypothetical protein
MTPPESQDLLESEAFVRHLFAGHPTTAPERDLAMRAARQSRRRRRLSLGAAVLVVAGVVVATAAVTQTVPPAATPAESPHGNLTDEQYAAAVGLVRQEVARVHGTVTTATATLRSGTESTSNMGYLCDSGQVLDIMVFGTFQITTGGLLIGASEHAAPVSALLITADAETGRGCLMGVQTGEVSPDPGAVVLDLG